MNDQNKQSSTGLVPAGQEGTGLTPGRSFVPVQLGVAPHSLEEGWRLAQVMAKSSLVPKDFQNKPEDVLVAIQLGIEIGLAPMQSLQSIAVINGRPSVWGDGFLALIMSSAAYQDHDEYYEVDGKRVDGLTAADLTKETTAAVCTFQRKNKATATTQKFTIAMAKKAGLIGKTGPWGTYPDRMLKMRARSWAGRDAFPDVLRGITTAEEAMDIPPQPEPARVVPMQAPQRLSAQAPIPPASQESGGGVHRVEPSGGDSAPASAAPAETSAGVLIADVVPHKTEGEPTALVIDEHGTQYAAYDRGVIFAAQVAKEKGYRMEIVSVRKGDESVIEEINRAAAPEMVGK